MKQSRLIIIISSIRQSSEHSPDSESEEGEKKNNEGLVNVNTYLNFLMTHIFVTEQELLTVCRLQENISKHNACS